MTNPLVVYHASNHDFKIPSIEMIHKNITNHSNGLLGLWCALNYEWIGGFGKIIYKLEIDSNHTYLDINISDFAERCKPRDIEFNSHEEVIIYYESWRTEMLNDKIDALRVIENTGKCDMLIIINFDSITKVSKLSDLH